MGKEDRDHYDRPSWKELDRRKDGHGYIKEGGTAKKGRQAGLEGARQEYLSSINAMFSTTSAQRKDLEALKAAKTGPEFDGLAAHYLATYGLPSDFEELLKLADASSFEILQPVLTRLGEIIVGENDRRKELYRSKLRLIGLTIADPRVERLLERLRGH
ncbi:MAG: hypothetical protein A2284_05280 [Deltaproteobacteria bacterium RIFOXYA12_FULL_61_11]|nr:MAG: hypothetical protein A2284_05280 [Deltaproteobacteria bacterium RIFOXYA12_FULL_61_11]